MAKPVENKFGSKAGGYYGCIPYLTEELIRAKRIKIELEDGTTLVYDTTGKIPKLVSYSTTKSYIF